MAPLAFVYSVAPRQVSGENTRLRGGGGSSASGGSRGSPPSSGGFKAPAPAPASPPKSPSSGSSSSGSGPVKRPLPPAPKQFSKPSPKLPAPAPPGSKPAPKSGSWLPKLPKPKSGAGPSTGKPKTGELPKAPKLPGSKPHNKLPHLPAVGDSGDHSKHYGSHKLGGCGIKCRSAVAGTFGVLGLVSLVLLVVFCIYRRKKANKASRSHDTERGRKSRPRRRSYPDGRRWWGEPQSKPKVSQDDDGMELTQHTTRGVSFTMSANGSEHSAGPHRGEIQAPSNTPAIPHEEPGANEGEAATPLGDSQTRDHQSAGDKAAKRTLSMRSNKSNFTWKTAVTVQSDSSCESCRLDRERMVDGTLPCVKVSAARRPLSVDSDRSTSENPVSTAAPKAPVVPKKPYIQMCIGWQGYQPEKCELQRRGAKRNRDRPDLSKFNIQRTASPISMSGRTFMLGDNEVQFSDVDELSITQDDKALVIENDEPDRGRSSRRGLPGRKRQRKARMAQKGHREGQAKSPHVHFPGQPNPGRRWSSRPGVWTMN